MNKEIKLLIFTCKTNRQKLSVDELAAMMNLKFKEGIYPYINRLPQLYKVEKGIYELNENDEKVKIVKFLQKIYQDYTEILLSIHTRRILERFSKQPILKATELPYHNLRQIKEIAKKTKIVHITRERSSEVYFIRAWEEPVKKILQFFSIKLDFDEEDYKHQIVRLYSTFTGTQTHLKTEKDLELAKMNMQ